MANKENLNENVSIIIRSVGERTESLCKQLVLAQGVSEENITIIKKTPFTLALQAAYETGITFDRRWTLCLDADVLLLPNSIHEMRNLAEKQDPKIFEFRGLILDKFFGGPRQGGIHLYRTSLLSQALKHIPKDLNDIRPEQNTLRAMKNQGFPWRRINYLVGIHDFEQYYADIFRKCFVHAHKHQEFAEIFVSYWPPQAARDLDYKVAINGFIAGLEYVGDVRIDIHQEIYRERFEKQHIDEKAAILPGNFSLSDIERLVINWKEPREYNKYFQIEMNRKKRFVEIRRSLGLFKLLMFLFGFGLEKIGGRIMDLVEKPNDK